MKRILYLLVLLMAMTSSTFAVGDISLSVSDMQFDWGGWGGSADATENSITFPNWANNYWTADNLSTDEYTRLDMVFAQPVNYYRMVVKAVYSDESETESVISYGATSHSLTFEQNKTLVKIVMLQGDWEGLNKVNDEDVSAKIYFESISIVGSGGSDEPTTYEDVSLSVADMQLPWDGTKDASEKSCTFGDIWSENYWTVGNLSTDIYTRLDMTFAQPVNFYKVRVKAVYSDGSETDTEITYGAESHSVTLTAGKKLVKITMKQFDQKNLNGGAKVKVYFDDIIIRTKESAAAVTPKTWTSSFKLGSDRANPLLDFHYIADPTAIEYNGRLYVYGTNDHQQYEAGTPSNTYEAIQSLVVISTDDMVNWTYHGLIDVKSVAPWIMASWAPTIISKPQADGSTLFSLYFSNSGMGSGVIQATSPLGPWTSPLTQNLTGGFDPGAVIDANGDGWLAYGTGESYIVKLGDDLHSVAAGPVKLNAPYYFEANELNYIGGKYVHTYNNDWSSHEPWTYGGEKPTACSMNYFTTTTPLDADSWTYGANYFKNTGENGMNYGNNHTHLHKYQGKWYLFYQSNDLEPSLGTNGGFRSIFVDEIDVDEENVVISECTPTFTGVKAIKNLDPTAPQYAATSAATLGIVYEEAEGNGHTVAKVGSPNMTADAPTQGIIEVRNADFTNGTYTLTCLVKGEGSVALRLDDKDGTDIASISSNGDNWQEQTAECSGTLSGTHTVYLVLTGDVKLDTWQFVINTDVNDTFEAASQAVANMKIGWNLGNTLESNSGDVHNMWIEQYTNRTPSDYETAWGQPVTRPELFKLFKNAGFNAIRIPVTWYPHMEATFSTAPEWNPESDPVGTQIQAEWMARVHEVVDAAISEGMYCILNVHHDTGAGNTAWLIADSEHYAAQHQRFEAVWTQIANEFKDYDEHLLFEGYNEMLDAYGSWSYASSQNSGSYDADAANSSYNAINSYAQSFVNAVRATGGNNAYRNLIVNTYGACTGEGSWSTHLKEPLTQMQRPEDNVEDHIIFEVHSYPSLANGLSSTKASVNNMMDAIEQYLVSKGAPVIFGEWGVPDDERETDYTEKNSEMLAFAQYFVEQAKARGFATFHWMGLSDGDSRSVPEFNEQDLVDAIVKGYYGDVVKVNISSVGYATFGYDSALDLNGIDAYTATISGNYVVLNSIMGKKIPANTGIVLKGSGVITIPVTSDSTDDVGENDLLVSDGSVTGDESTIYVLANGNNGIGFYLLRSGGKVAAQRAYLKSSEAIEASPFYGFDETTGMDGEIIQMDDLSQTMSVYDLQGRRINVTSAQTLSALPKGIYIVNGRKMVFK